MSDNYTSQSLSAIFEKSLCDNWNNLALTDLDGLSLQYRDLARKIAKLDILLESAGIRPGDKIALCGKNSAQMAVAVLAVMAYGAVAVPLLHEFKPDSIQALVCHSDSRMLIVDEAIWKHLHPSSMPSLEGVLLTADFASPYAPNKQFADARHHLNELFGIRYPDRFTPADVKFRQMASHDELVLISYTSGSTGSPKGVMLPERSLLSNLVFGIENTPYLRAGDNTVMILPMAHMFGLVIEMMLPVAKGCHVNFISRPPSPHVLLDAFARVKPRHIIGVPLILEKIIRTKVFPLLEKPLMKILLHVPYVDDVLLGRVKDQINQAFGGNMEQFIIGGAPLNKEVEAFLRRIEFHFTVGYGMTECGPLIAYAPWDKTRPQSCGRVVTRMEARVASDNPAEKPGVISTRGENVMLGYYKNPEATAEVLGADGWLDTGDMGCIGTDGYVYIRGRDKTMILGPSGQNIYPEEVEQILNNLPYVSESLVVDRDGRLVALIVPDRENAVRQGLDEQALQTLMADNIKALNHEVPSYSQVSRFEILDQEFEKTPKKSIKRFLYS